MEVKSVSAAALIPILEKLVEQNQGVRLTVTGTSMKPFLRNDIDSVLLVKRAYTDIKLGDIILIKRVSGEYVLHRVVKIRDRCIFIAGDAQNWLEGPIFEENILAVADKIYRRQKCFSCSNVVWKMLSFFWVSIFPIRGILIRIKRKAVNLWH